MFLEHTKFTEKSIMVRRVAINQKSWALGLRLVGPVQQSVLQIVGVCCFFALEEHAIVFFLLKLPGEIQDCTA